MNDITSKPIDQISWSDIEQLVSDGIEEGPFLEFKDGLIFDPEKGKRHARDDISKEIVSFANAYGGTLIIGVRESDCVAVALDNLVGDLAARAENLQRAVRDVIDPPIAGLVCRAVYKGENTGVIVFRVSASQAAPHGVGTPPQCYLRQGKNANPMSMRDVQSVFWDARTRQERVSSIRAEARAEYTCYGPRYAESPEARAFFLDPKNHPLGLGLSFRATAIPQQSFIIDPLPLQDWTTKLRPSVREISKDCATAFGDGLFVPNLTRVIQGAKSRNINRRSVSSWSIWSSGAISVGGFHEGYANSPGMNQHFPGWYIATATQILIMADRLRRQASVPDIIFEMDLEIANDGTAFATRDRDIFYGSSKPLVNSSTVGPIIVGPRSEFDSIIQYISKEIWAYFGIDNNERFEVDWEKIFAN